MKSRSGSWEIVELVPPLNRVYEDRVPRVVDLDRDGNEELVLVEADTLRGASLVVLSLDKAGEVPRLVERARGPFVGSPFRWLNPMGVADFDADGQLDIASVVTPHVGGVLQLLHFRPPALVPFARAMDVSNHRMGALEQSLAAILHAPGQRPTVVLPDMTRRALHAFRWGAPGQWTELADLKPLPGLVERLAPTVQGACAALANGRSLRIVLSPPQQTHAPVRLGGNSLCYLRFSRPPDGRYFPHLCLFTKDSHHGHAQPGQPTDPPEQRARHGCRESGHL